MACIQLILLLKRCYKSIVLTSSIYALYYLYEKKSCFVALSIGLHHCFVPYSICVNVSHICYVVCYALSAKHTRFVCIHNNPLKLHQFVIQRTNKADDMGKFLLFSLMKFFKTTVAGWNKDTFISK